ncbi:MAG: hypothetical protein O9320_20610 [Magnetospirillum sp.]|nr:hypothetical protein [Magnetospirillum sp.]
MRIFVGTLESGEAEFAESSAAISAQQNVSVTRHVISGLPEYKAHNALWAAWAAAKTTHDLFVKIDADTVLNRPTALKEIAALFADRSVTGAQLKLLDYFTTEPMPGMNAFSPDVVFAPARKRLYSDHADSGHRKVLKGDAVRHLEPIAWHCRNPNPRQAFHFGFRRMLKRQADVISALTRAWRREPLPGREWAMAGAASVRWWMRLAPGAGARNLGTAFARMADAELRGIEIRRFAEAHIPQEKGEAA